MGKMKIDFSDVESTFEPLPEGEYEFVVERVEVRESNSSDNDYLNWELTVQDEEYEGRKLWMITSFSPKALFRLKEVLVNLGVIEEDDELDIDWDDDVDITPKEGPQVTDPDLVGVAGVAVVSNEVYEGRERNRVAEVRGTEAAPAKKSGGRKAPAKRGSGAKRKLR